MEHPPPPSHPHPSAIPAEVALQHHQQQQQQQQQQQHQQQHQHGLTYQPLGLPHPTQPDNRQYHPQTSGPQMDFQGHEAQIHPSQMPVVSYDPTQFMYTTPHGSMYAPPPPTTYQPQLPAGHQQMAGYALDPSGDPTSGWHVAVPGPPGDLAVGVDSFSGPYGHLLSDGHNPHGPPHHYTTLYPVDMGGIDPMGFAPQELLVLSDPNQSHPPPHSQVVQVQQHGPSQHDFEQAQASFMQQQQPVQHADPDHPQYISVQGQYIPGSLPFHSDPPHHALQPTYQTQSYLPHYQIQDPPHQPQGLHYQPLPPPPDMFQPQVQHSIPAQSQPPSGTPDNSRKRPAKDSSATKRRKKEDSGAAFDSNAASMKVETATPESATPGEPQLLSRAHFKVVCKYCSKRQLTDPTYPNGKFSKGKCHKPNDPDHGSRWLSLRCKTCGKDVCTSAEIYKRHVCPPGFVPPTTSFKPYKEHKRRRDFEIDPHRILEPTSLEFAALTAASSVSSLSSQPETQFYNPHPGYSMDPAAVPYDHAPAGEVHPTYHPTTSFLPKSLEQPGTATAPAPSQPLYDFDAAGHTQATYALGSTSSSSASSSSSVSSEDAATPKLEAESDQPSSQTGSNATASSVFPSYITTTPVAPTAHNSSYSAAGTAGSFDASTTSPTPPQSGAAAPALATAEASTGGAAAANGTLPSPSLTDDPTSSAVVAAVRRGRGAGVRGDVLDGGEVIRSTQSVASGDGSNGAAVCQTESPAVVSTASGGTGILVG
ncbi:hypothetical protein DFJ73DRAFT_824575 [Zopfochytrium polystomum]|nr:hypothetical protein DFJ73DRAFT_824575 [Zopfochytrium polystomum]